MSAVGKDWALPSGAVGQEGGEKTGAGYLQGVGMVEAGAQRDHRAGGTAA